MDLSLSIELKSLLENLSINVTLGKTRYRWTSSKGQMAVNGYRVNSGLLYVHEYDEKWHAVHILSHRSIVRPFERRSEAITFAAAAGSVDGWDTDDLNQLQMFQGFCCNLNKFIIGETLVPSALDLVIKWLKK